MVQSNASFLSIPTVLEGRGKRASLDRTGFPVPRKTCVLWLGAIAASSWCFLEPVRTSVQNADEKLSVSEVSILNEEGSLQQRCDISSLYFSPLSNFCLGCSLPFGRLTLEMTFLLMPLSLSQGARVPLSSWILNQKPASAHRLLSQTVPFGSSNNQHTPSDMNAG